MSEQPTLWGKIKTCSCCKANKEKAFDDDEQHIADGVPVPAETPAVPLIAPATQRRLLAKEKSIRPLLSWLPFMLLVCMANTEPYAATWTAFAFALALNLNDFVQSRLQGGVLKGGVFPTTVNFTSLLVYVLLIIVADQNPSFERQYLGPIAGTFITAAVFFSMVFSRPFSMETTSNLLVETNSEADRLRASPSFLQFNQLVTGYVLVWFCAIMASMWIGACVGQLGSALQIVLSIVVPVVGPLLMFLSLPCFAGQLRQQSQAHANDPDRESLLFKAENAAKENEEDEDDAENALEKQ